MGVELLECSHFSGTFFLRTPVPLLSSRTAVCSPISLLATDVLMVAFVKVLEFLAGKLSSPWTTSVCLLIPLTPMISLC